MNPAIQGLITIAIGVSGCIGYFYFANLLLDTVIFPARGPDQGRNINRANKVRPWIFIFPALFALSVYLAYPVIETIRLSLTDRSLGDAFIGLDNYRQIASESKFWEAMRNNMLWLIVVPAVSTFTGLLAAQLTDRLSWGNIAKSLIFMPMAISFVGASVIFKLIYDARPEDQNQIGVLNALWMKFEGGVGSLSVLRIVPTVLFFAFALAVGFIAWHYLKPVVSRTSSSIKPAFAPLRWLMAIVAAAVVLITLRSILNLWLVEHPYGEPQQWLTLPFYNNFFLMAVLVWIQTGFAMVILSAALRGIPEETIEAAIIDGANPFQVFFSIKMPQIVGTIMVVWTTITLTVLKVFDIVFAMTNGQWQTQVLANYMFEKLFRANDWGAGSAVAIIIMILVSPILAWNVYSARKELR